MSSVAVGRMIETLRRSTVVVRSGRGRSGGTGSGVVLDADRVITNAHVTRRDVLEVESWEGHHVQARVAVEDRFRDLAMLTAPGLNAPAAYLSDSDSLRAGDLVVAVGNPFGFTGAASVGTVRTPTAESLLNVNGQRWICTDAHLAPGCSGGPLADAKGGVIGINTMITGNGLSFAVPSRAVQALLLREHQRRSLGVTVRPVGLQNGRRGMLILELVHAGPAERAALLPGDVMVAGNGRKFELLEDLQASIDEAGEGILRIEFMRGGEAKPRRVAVQLAVERVASAA